MAEIKFGLIIAYLIGIPGGVLAFIANFNSWQSNLIFIVMILNWVILSIYRFRQKVRVEIKEKSEQRVRDIEEEHKRLDLIERQEKRNNGE
jgi:uncharacterized membrane protein